MIVSWHLAGATRKRITVKGGGVSEIFAKLSRRDRQDITMNCTHVTSVPDGGITKAQIIRKREEVNLAYSTYGFHSAEYQRSFDELHDMNLVFMAQQYRNARGLPTNTRTPYCP